MPFQDKKLDSSSFLSCSRFLLKNFNYGKLEKINKINQTAVMGYKKISKEENQEDSRT